MKKLNKYFSVSYDADYTLVSKTYLVLKAGYAVVLEGGHIDVHQGGCAEVRWGGHADVWEGGSATVWEGGLKTCNGAIPVEIAKAGGHKLRMCQGLFQAGCSSWLARDVALNRWNREDDRALLFTLAILSCDWGKA